MPLYRYKAQNEQGKKAAGALNAESEDALYAMLRRDGLFLTECRVAENERSTVRKLKPMELSEFCRQLSSMIGSGITLSRAMNIILMGNLKPAVASVYRQVQRLVQQGQPLSDALSAQGVFPDMMVNMFRAGEASGQMEQVAGKLATHYQKEHRMNDRLKSATLYPKILAGVCVAAVLIIFLVVMPELEPFFEGMTLPAFTQALMGFSALLQSRWYVVVIALLALVALVQVLLTVPFIRFAWDKLKVRMPLVGKQLRIIYTARFARTQSSLYSSGLSMIRSLEIAAATVGNQYIYAQFADVVKQVRAGDMLSKAIQQVDGFDAKLAPTIYVGEETGQLDKMLENIAENYEYESDIALNRLTGMIEPAMIVIMAIVVCLIMLGVLIPIFDMYGNAAAFG